MNTKTLQSQLEARWSLLPTREDLEYGFKNGEAHYSSVPRRGGTLPALMLAVTAITTNVTYTSPNVGIRGSESVEIQRGRAQRPGKRISLGRAREIALEASTLRERNLREERRAELAFLLHDWEESGSETL